MLNVPASSLFLYQAPADLLSEGGWQVVRSNGVARGGVRRMLWYESFPPR